MTILNLTFTTFLNYVLLSHSTFPLSPSPSFTSSPPTPSSLLKSFAQAVKSLSQNYNPPSPNPLLLSPLCTLLPLLLPLLSFKIFYKIFIIPLKTPSKTLIQIIIIIRIVSLFLPPILPSTLCYYPLMAETLNLRLVSPLTPFSLLTSLNSPPPIPNSPPPIPSFPSTTSLSPLLSFLIIFFNTLIENYSPLLHFP